MKSKSRMQHNFHNEHGKALDFLFKVMLILFIPMPQFGWAQTTTQTVRGRVVDNETQSPLIGATLVVIGTNPLLGAITDVNGNYKITNVPLGRQSIQVNYVGYKTVWIPEVMVTSGKEVVNQIGMIESVSQMKEVKINASTQKDKTVNSMALVSARSFTVEETRRYAGGLDDPGRLASAFAGVTANNISDNSICIRCNSPKGVSWRLEGVEIPNPSHFSGANVAGGGLVTLFSSQLLANSDFFTGAFPAEYGNALAGVFDMKLRNGNNEKREHTFQLGMMGVDLASEGPLKKGGGSTYLFNYRYSTFGLLTKLGIIPSAELPTYQDLSFKFNFPTHQAGTFSLWGIGGMDHSIKSDISDSLLWEKDWDRINYNWNIRTGALGVNHRITLGNKSYLNTALVGSGIQNSMDATRLDNNLVRKPNWYFVDESGKITLSSFVNHKFNARFTVKSGVNHHRLFYHIDLNSTQQDNPETFQNTVRENSTSSFSEAYVQSKIDLTDAISMNVGVNYHYFALNNSYSIDPRASIRWNFLPRHAISFGYGKHSQLEELKIYLYNKSENGQSAYPNKNLESSQAQHFVVGYDWSVSDHLRLKVEPYYQYLYGIPGLTNSSYSLINFKQDWAFRNALANNSTGRNVGIEFTFERFLHRNFYYLVTTSIFDSRYRGDDGVWRNTRFNRGFVMNVLGGKEIYFRNNHVLGLNGRFTLMGGERTSPVKYVESIKRKEVVYDESRAFESQTPVSYNLDLSVSYRINKQMHSSVWSLQLKNALGSPMFGGHYYNYKTQAIEKDQVTVVLPSLSYKIEF